jgi:hypothetical protein
LDPKAEAEGEAEVAMGGEEEAEVAMVEEEAEGDGMMVADMIGEEDTMIDIRKGEVVDDLATGTTEVEKEIAMMTDMVEVDVLTVVVQGQREIVPQEGNQEMMNGKFCVDSYKCL